jgi:hypothetical protein
MFMDREKVYFVDPRDEWWRGVEGESGKCLMEGLDKRFIIQRMEEKAKLNRPSKLIIHSQDGNIESEEVFSKDKGFKNMEDMLTSD